jgi:protocatechuate 3,4-dioxygenase beta subunit
MIESYLLALVLAGAAFAGDGDADSVAKAANATLAGTVLDVEGQPVSGADVWLAGGSLRLEPELQGHTRTDSEGRFEISVPDRWFTRLAKGSDAAVYAWKDGMRLAVLNVPQRSIPPAESVRLVLRPAAETRLTVHDPQGRPAGGVRLRVSALALGSGQRELPDELSSRFAVTTDEDGQALVTAVAADQVNRVLLESEDYGQQDILVPLQRDWTSPLVLGPVGRLSGRITAPEPGLVSGLTLDVVTHTFSEGGQPVAKSVVQVTTDAAGRFEIAAIRHGVLTTQVHLPAETPWRARTTQTKQESGILSQATDWAVTGDLTEVEIPLEPAVRATGIVREQETGHPLAGVDVHVSSRAGWNQVARTDDSGRFVTHVLHGRPWAVPWCPRGWFPAQPRIELPQVSPNTEQVEFPAIELLRAVTVRGRVVDEQRQPVSGAIVRAVWSHGMEERASEEAHLTTDDRGEFAVDGVHPRGRLGLRAKSEDAVTERMLQWQAGNPGPVMLSISETNWLTPAGRVIDSTGAPVAGASVSIREQVYLRLSPDEPLERPVDGPPEIATDEQGRFAPLPRLEPYGIYRAEASAPGFPTARTDWVPFSRLHSGFPPIVLPRLVDVSGRVIDSRGKGLAGASITLDNGTERVKAAADPEGRFRLQDVPVGTAFLFVHKPAYRLSGRLISTDADIAGTLFRRDEPASVMKASPSALDREERHALARRLIEPLLKPGGKKDTESMLRAGELLASIDPAGALEWLETEPRKPAQVGMAVRVAVAQQLAKTDPDEALLIGESIEQPIWRSKVYLDVCDALPEDGRPRKLEILGQAILYARGSDNPAFRAFLLGQVGERLLDLGETNRATEVLRDGEQIARELSTAGFLGYTRGAFAVELAQIDLPAALELAGNLSDASEYNRHHGNIAHELAGKRPAEAERVLNMIKVEDKQYIVHRRDQYLVRVCYRMAAVDLERARKLSRSAHDACQRAYACGVMAQALAGTETERAETLLREAFGILQAHVDAGQDRFNYVYSASTIAGALLPIAETIDPALRAELFWQAVSMRLLPGADQAQAQLAELSDAILAMHLARYDRDVAQSLLLRLGSSARGTENWLRAMALVSPRQAAVHVEQFGSSDEGLRRQNARDRLTVAGMLVLDGDGRELLNRTGLWQPDTEDLR